MMEQEDSNSRKHQNFNVQLIKDTSVPGMSVYVPNAE
jgi:hypothetical protein